MNDSKNLSLDQLELFDPGAPKKSGERDYCCPLPGCAGKAINSKHRCLSVNMDNGAWLCHRCGEQGKLKEFRDVAFKHPTRQAYAPAALQRAFALPQALPTRAQTEPARFDWRDQVRGMKPLDDTPGETYLMGRNIPVAVAGAARVRYVPDFFNRPAIVFPIRDRQDQTVAVQARFIDGAEDRQQTLKTQTVGPKKLGLFSTPDAFKHEFVIVAEAPIDALSLAVAGFPAVAFCGKSGYPDWLLKACAYRMVCIAFDADEPGDEAANSLTGVLLEHGCSVRRLRPDGAKDWNEFLAVKGLDAVKEALVGTVLSSDLRAVAGGKPA